MMAARTAGAAAIIRSAMVVRRSRRVLGAAAAAIRMAGPGNPRPSARHRGDALIMIRVKIEENGRTRTVTAQEVIIRNLVNAAARRDLKAINTLLALRQRVLGSTKLRQLALDDFLVFAVQRARIEGHLGVVLELMRRSGRLHQPGYLQ